MPRMTFVRFATSLSRLVLCTVLASMWLGCAGGGPGPRLRGRLRPRRRQAQARRQARAPQGHRCGRRRCRWLRERCGQGRPEGRLHQDAAPINEAGLDGDASSHVHNASDARADTGFDAGYDAGIIYWGPPGSPCGSPGALQGQECGRCGKQTSTCIVRPDGGVPSDGARTPGASSTRGTTRGTHCRPTSGARGGRAPASFHRMPAACLAPRASPPAASAAPGRSCANPTACTGRRRAPGEVDGGCSPGTVEFVVVPSCGAPGVADGGGADATLPDAEADAVASDGGRRDATLGDGGGRDATLNDGAPGEGGGPDGSHRDAAGTDAPAKDADPTDAGIDVLTVVGVVSVCSQTCGSDASSACGPPPTTLTVSNTPQGKVGTIVNFVPSHMNDTLEAQDCPTAYLSRGSRPPMATSRC